MAVSGKVVMITGATSQIGRRLAEVFAGQGAKLALVVRRPQDAVELERELLLRGCDAFLLSCDLRYEEDVVRMVHRLIQRFTRVDVVINAANVAGPKLALMDYPVDPWRNVLATNLTGTYLICREVLPWMMRQGGGSIINVTTGLSSTPRGHHSASFVSNHGLESLTRMLAAEVRGSGVLVNTVDVGAAIAAGKRRAERTDWIEPFLWLADDSLERQTGQRILASSWSRKARDVKH